MNATRTILDPSDALDYAIRAARSALAKHGSDVAIDLEDVASEAVCRIVARGLDLTAPSVAAAVRNVTHEYWRARYANRALSLDAPVGSDTGTLADTLADRPQDIGGSGRAPLTTTVGAFTLTVPMDRHGADVDRAVLTDAAGRIVATGRSAVRQAEAANRQAQRGTAHGAGSQSAAAVDRDAAVLAVEGMPWRDALAVLEGQGITLSRGALRNAQTVARRRLQGLTAKGR